jgi:DNA polymerase-3 subunit epsilon
VEYSPAVVALQELIAGRDVAPLHGLVAQLDSYATTHRFEEAAGRRDRIAALIRVLDRGQRLAALASLAELVAARPDGEGGWEFAVVRYGRLASAGVARRGTRYLPVVEALVASAETVVPGDGPLKGVSPEEAGLVLRWLNRPGTRLVRCDTPWSSPAASAGGWREWVELADAGRDQYKEYDH